MRGALALSLAGCGYHALGSAAHLPLDVRTLSVPLFATRTEAYHTETVMTEAVIREFAARTLLRVSPSMNWQRYCRPSRLQFCSRRLRPLTCNTPARSSLRAFSSRSWLR